jgi:hypothetical protein
MPQAKFPDHREAGFPAIETAGQAQAEAADAEAERLIAELEREQPGTRVLIDADTGRPIVFGGIYPAGLTARPAGFSVMPHYPKVDLPSSGAEITIAIALDAEATRGLIEKADPREQALRTELFAKVQASAEHKAFMTAEERLAELLKRRAEVQHDLRVFDHRAQPGDDLVARAENERNLRQHGENIARALQQAQALRDEAAVALHRRTLELANEVRLKALADVAAVEKTAAGLIKVAEAELRKVIETARLSGAIRSHQWADAVALFTAKSLVGGDIPTVAPFQPPAAPPPAGWNIFKGAAVPLDDQYRHR